MNSSRYRAARVEHAKAVEEAAPALKVPGLRAWTVWSFGFPIINSWHQSDEWRTPKAARLDALRLKRAGAVSVKIFRCHAPSSRA